ncbi:MAG: hypothetical protein WCK28_00105 [Burkholderiales bacterium]|jgi:hypothetical protein
MQLLFGSGALFGTPQFDATGATVSNPTPVQFGVLQNASLDVSFDLKTLYGQNQFPQAVGRGKGSITGKASFAQLNGALLNSLFFGQTLTSGITSDVYDTTGTAVPGSPYQITPTVPNSGTWSADLGVRDSNGVPMTRVASAPATGQYSVAAGVYTFAAADTTKVMFISFQYTATSTTAKKSTIQNLIMGAAPAFRVDLYLPFQGKSLIFTCPYAIGSKLSLATKNDDFVVPDFDFTCFADAAGNVLTYALSE